MLSPFFRLYSLAVCHFAQPISKEWGTMYFPQIPNTQLSSYCLFPAFSRISFKWNHILCKLSDWFLSLSSMYLRFIPIFSLLNSFGLFVLIIESYPLYWYNTVCLFIDILKVIYSFWWLRINLLYTFMWWYLYWQIFTLFA